MSMKRLATMSAIGSHSLNSNNNNNNSNNNSNSSVTYYTTEKGGGHHQGLQTMRPSANLHGNVNIMLGGAMLSVVITVVCFVCYCCHRNIKKRSTSSTYRQRWLENDPNMEIYSVEQCYDTSALFMDSQEIISSSQLPQTTLPTLQGPGHGPPPSYEQVVAYDELAARQYQQQYKQFQINNYCPFAPISGASSLLSPTLMTQHQSSSSSFNNLDHMDTNDNDSYILKCDSNDKNDNEMMYLNNNNIIISDTDNNIRNMCRYCGKYTALYLNGSNDSSININNISNNNNNDYSNININNFIDKCRCTNITSNIENHLNNNDIEILDSNQNFPSTSTSSSSTSSNNNNQQPLIATNDNNNNNNDDESSFINNNDSNNKIDFDNLNENGLIRLDMSQIIDNTGLPTYEAALKLESSGYV